MGNLSNAIAIVQTAENALKRRASLIGWMLNLTLTQKSLRSSYSYNERKAMQTQIRGMINEMGDLARETRFGNKRLFDGFNTAAERPV
ncbi:hypothetical protein [Parendozoicomonas sp. Alg238-R29]|uniref:flagellin N-terminal helical domain-containing protein n=1 Tax=Parendozoicomonas sp. Alg238-R29 TaxID=2993446 RepID=UPI00248EE2CD|nr:hypothetical protein [Parendozoicomonas sp. Alg238-R29]